MLISMSEFELSVSYDGEAFLDHAGADPVCSWEVETVNPTLAELIKIATRHVKDKHSTR